MKACLSTLAAVAALSLSAQSYAQDAPESARVAPPAADAVSAPGDERTANNTIYAELLGPGLFYSINYDRTFGDVAARIGFSYFSVGVSVSDGQGGGAESGASFMTFPLTVSYLGLGSKKHMFEVGAGVTLLSLEAGASTFGAESDAESGASALVVAPTGILGYSKEQPPDGGFFLHAGLAPQLFIGGRDMAIRPAPYLGLGGTF